MSEPGRPSGLRNPGAAVRGVAAAALVVESLVLLLAIAPLTRVAGRGGGYAVWLVVVLAGYAAILAGMLRRGWAYRAGLVVPVGLLVGGLLHWSLAVLGVVFGLLWGYVLNVRRTVLGSASPTAGSPSGLP